MCERSGGSGGRTVYSGTPLIQRMFCRRVLAMSTGSEATAEAKPLNMLATKCNKMPSLKYPEAGVRNKNSKIKGIPVRTRISLPCVYVPSCEALTTIARATVGVQPCVLQTR